MMHEFMLLALITAISLQFVGGLRVNETSNAFLKLSIFGTSKAEFFSRKIGVPWLQTPLPAEHFMSFIYSALTF